MTNDKIIGTIKAAVFREWAASRLYVINAGAELRLTASEMQDRINSTQIALTLITGVLLCMSAFSLIKIYELEEENAKLSNTVSIYYDYSNARLGSLVMKVDRDRNVQDALIDHLKLAVEEDGFSPSIITKAEYLKKQAATRPYIHFYNMEYGTGIICCPK